MIAKAYIFTKVCLLLNNIKLCSVIIISHFFLFSNKKSKHYACSLFFLKYRIRINSTITPRMGNMALVSMPAFMPI